MGECGPRGLCTHPCEDGEEGEGDGGPGCVRPFVQRVVLGLGDLPLIGQVAEAHEPEEGPEGWGVSTSIMQNGPRVERGGRGGKMGDPRNKGRFKSTSPMLPHPKEWGGAERRA